MRTFTGIQAMRGVAALAVVLAHLVSTRMDMGISLDTASVVTGVFRCGVDVFFVISGFIIALSATNAGKAARAGVPRFAFKRFVRIYPLYWIVLAVTVLSVAWFPTASSYLPKKVDIDYSDFLQQALLVTTDTTFVGPAWSMAYEIAFYLATVIVIVIAPKRIMETLIAAAATLAIVDVLPVPQAPGLLSNPLVIEFGLGVVAAYLIHHQFVWRLWPICLLLAAALFAYAVSKTTPNRWVFDWPRVWTFGLGSALVIYAFAAAELRGMTFPIWLQYLGAISYSLYVWHILALRWVASTADFLSPFVPSWIQMPLWLLFTVAVAAACYELIERPILAWARSGRLKELPLLP